MNQTACAICGEPLATDRATCYRCGREFHLALRTDRPAPDCGDTWIDDEVQALIFACNACLGRLPEPPKHAYRRREGMSARAVARRRAGGRAGEGTR
jgi:hypothetical protein